MASSVSSSAWGCHIGNCDFPAPGTDIFFYEDVVKVGPFGFDKPMILLFLGAFVVIAFFLIAFRKPKIVPRGIQNIGELGYTFIRDGIARDVIGKGGEKFVPFLMAFFFLVWVLNFMGIVPGIMFPPTATFAIPVAFALLVYFTWIPLGIMKQGFFGFFKNMMFPPGLPKALYLILAPIELISNIIVRPFTHCVRLFANMFAGHLLLTTFAVASWFLFSASAAVLGSGLSFVVVIALTGFEMLIQGLQAYIFTLLAAVYIAGALHAEH